MIFFKGQALPIHFSGVKGVEKMHENTKYKKCRATLICNVDYLSTQSYHIKLYHE